MKFRDFIEEDKSNTRRSLPSHARTCVIIILKLSAYHAKLTAKADFTDECNVVRNGELQKAGVTTKGLFVKRCDYRVRSVIS